MIFLMASFQYTVRVCVSKIYNKLTPDQKLTKFLQLMLHYLKMNASNFQKYTSKSVTVVNF